MQIGNRNPMSLSDAHLAFLEAFDPRRGATLCDELAANAFHVEAQLLRQYLEGNRPGARIDVPGSPWNGLRAHLAPLPPTEAEAGDVWFDPCEIAAMILLPRVPLDADDVIAPDAAARVTPWVSWMALRPVAGWQYRSFLRAAPITPRETQVEPPFAFLDAQRILHGGESEPVTRLTCGEAALYAAWFGKSLARLEDWQAAAAFLPGNAMHALWGPLPREWAGACSFDESLRIAATRENYRLDPRDEADSDVEPVGALRLLFDEWAQHDGLGFRCHVSTQTGVLSGAGPNPYTLDPAYVAAPLRRRR
jgi:hypothetical protein